MNKLIELPFELILKISQHLTFSDLWYLGICSHNYRTLSYQLIHQQYAIDLIQPRVINPLNNLIHAAVAYLGHYGYKNNKVQLYIIQSVANQLVLEIDDRLPTSNDREASLDFLLDKTLSVLLDHCLHDPTLPSSTHSPDQIHGSLPIHIRTDRHEEEEEVSSTGISFVGVVMVDFLVIFYEILMYLFSSDRAFEIYHRLLINHLHRILDTIKHNYHTYHITLSSYSQNTPELNIQQTKHCQEFKQFINLLCLLIETNLVTNEDIEAIVVHRINSFFMTRPSDVTFTTLGGFKILIRNPNSSLVIVNTVTKHKSPAFYYQWKLWLQETLFRLRILLDLFRCIISKPGASPPEFNQLSQLLQETVSAISLSNELTQADEEEAAHVINI